MKRDSLIITSLELRRAPGLPRQGFVLAELAPGINLIHGPQGVGKTTTARALAELLFPHRSPPQGWSLLAHFAIGEEPWQAELEAGRLTYRHRGGSAASPPDLPPAVMRDRYDLALEHLLARTHEPLAAEIAREAAGGFDLAGAAAAAGFRREASRQPSLSAALGTAERAVARLRSEQEALAEEEGELAALEGQRARLRDLGREREGLERALALAEAREERVARRAELEAFPEVVRRLAGDEARRLAELEARRDQEEGRRAAAEKRLAELGPDEASPALAAAALEALGRRADELAEGEREVLEFEGALAAAEEKAGIAAAELGEVSDGLRVAATPLATAAQGFDALLRREEAQRAAEAVAERSHAALGEDGPVADLAALEQGARLLSRWLAEPGAPLGRAVTWLLTLFGLGVAGLSLAASGLPPLARGVGAGTGLALAALALALAFAAARRQQWERELRAARLATPQRFRRNEVEQALAALERQLAEARRRALAQELRGRLGVEPARLAAERRALDDLRAELAASLGLTPRPDALGLTLAADRLRALSGARDATAEARGRLAAARQRVSHLRSELGAALAPHGLGTVEGAAGVRSALLTLGRRAQEIAARRQERQLLRARLEDEIRPALATLADERGELFASVGLAEDEGARLEEATALLPPYRKAREELLLAERELERASALAGEAAVLAERGAAGLRVAVAEAAEELRAREEVERRAIEIETRLAEAQKRHDLEAALLARDEARAKLRAARDRDYEAVAGWVLAETLQRTAREHHAPMVLRRAEELFAAITRNRYQLRIHAGDPPALNALDQTTGLAQGLPELSAGTRVQLLLAVRVAFIEGGEPGAALPLFLDEVLATSDPERSRAVMDAVCDLARAGRQIFFFTAQPEEVAKWQVIFAERAARGEGVAHAAIDLARVRQLGEARALPLPLLPTRAMPPSPAGLDREAYGRLLGVPGLDPWAEDLGGLHLWHLIEDPLFLHQVLASGFERWGPLRDLLARGGGEALFPGRTREFERAEARARLIQVVLTAFRAGRGRPVDAAALAASGAVSETFFEPVRALNAEARGNAQALLDRLARGEVKGFRADKRQALESFLEDQGYLDRRTQKTRDELRLIALEALAAELGAGRLSIDAIDEVIEGTKAG